MTCCLIIPLCVFAPLYFLLSYKDTDGTYDVFELPFCRGRNVLYCVSGERIALILRNLAVRPPFFFAFVGGNIFMLSRACVRRPGRPTPALLPAPRGP